jgi:hypothetical protein
LLILKLTAYPAISWWWVFGVWLFPLWIALAFLVLAAGVVVLAFLAAFVFGAISSIFSK